MTSNYAKMNVFGATLRNVQASIKNRENQVEHLKAISLRNGKTIKARPLRVQVSRQKRVAIQEGPSAIEESIEESDQRDKRDKVSQSISSSTHSSGLQPLSYVPLSNSTSIFQLLKLVPNAKIWEVFKGLAHQKKETGRGGDGSS